MDFAVQPILKAGATDILYLNKIKSKGRFIVGRIVGRASAAFVIKIRLKMHYAVHSRPRGVCRTSAARRPHAADLASDRIDHSDASAACG